MCGILGVCGELIQSRRFDGALELLRHRGPDDSGSYQGESVTLGHRRLSIIDLSEAAKQPMRKNGRGPVLVFNGEIYNYLELRRELEGVGYEFRTKGDSEVLLTAFIEWGERCLDKLNGMWAFAVWDPDARRLFFARDRFGVKPFYYICDGRKFAFASEPKALAALYPEYKAADPVALYEFLAEGNLYGSGRSFYRGVNVLPPAYCGTYALGAKAPVVQRYWEYPASAEAVGSLGVAEEEFNSIFQDAVKLRLRSDVDVGLTLSGGLDSTAILAGANQEAGPSLKCFTSSYADPKAGEAMWAQRAARREGNPLTNVKADQADWIDTMFKIAWHMDGPGYSPAVFPLWRLMAEAKRQGVPVLLEGQGADEALGGYVQHSAIQFWELVKWCSLHPSVGAGGAVATSWRGMLKTYNARKVTLRLIRELFPGMLPLYRRVFGALGVMRRSFVQEARQAADGEDMDRRDREEGSYTVNGRLRMDHGRLILPGLLHYGDAVSMAHSIESRHPFLDYRLVEWAFRQPGSYKLARGQTKWFVRNYLRRRGWNEFADRWDKKGYPTPVSEWMREGDGRVPKELLLSPESRIADYCDPTAVRRLLRTFLSGGSGAENHLYRLISTEAWLRACL